MRLLFILPEFLPYTTGGISTYYQNLLPALHKAGCEITVIHGSATHSGKSHFNFEGIAVHDLDAELFRCYKDKFKKFEVYPLIRNHLAAAWAMYEQGLAMGSFDFIETCDFGWGYIPWVFNNHTNLSVTFHATAGEIDFWDPNPGKEFQEDMSRMIDLCSMQYVYRFIASSTAAKRSWEERLNKKISRQLPPFLIPEQDAAAAPSPREPFGLVVGRIQYWKGPTVLCEALASLSTGLPEVYWLGKDMPYENTSMGRYLSQHFPTVWRCRVKPLGQMDRTEAVKYQVNADFVIVPSIWDVFNFTCVEAMALGKVVICSTGAGVSDIISNGENGFTFENKDAQGLAEAIARANRLTKSEKRKLGDKAIETIRQRLNPAALAKQRLAWYQTDVENAPLPLNPWIVQWLSPTASIGNVDKTLEDVSLKNLVDHTLKRLMKKVI